MGRTPSFIHHRRIYCPYRRFFLLLSSRSTPVERPVGPTIFELHIRDLEQVSLQWDQLSCAFKQLVYRPEVTNVDLEGIRNIPIDVSTMFLTKHSLRLSRCTYECDSIVTAPSRWPASNFKVNLSKLIFEWIGLEEASSARGEVTTILYH